jgi:hypothetical protein
MKTFVDVRLAEKWANQAFGTSLGQPMGEDGQAPYARRVVLEVGDPRLDDLKARLKRDRYYPAVIVDREYGTEELASAQLFQLIITECFHDDACGEDFGTEYDDSNACSTCGAGRVQLSPLRLDLSLASSGVDIVRTIAMNEIIVSERFMDLLRQNCLSGFHLNEVEHVGTNKPKGRWYQLNVTGRAGPTVEPTHFGINYFEEDAEGTYVCREHMLSGLHILSEAFVSRKNIEAADMTATSNRTGLRSGVLMPTSLILVSPRCVNFITDNNIQGCKMEVAHVVNWS